MKTFLFNVFFKIVLSYQVFISSHPFRFNNGFYLLGSSFLAVVSVLSYPRLTLTPYPRFLSFSSSSSSCCFSRRARGSSQVFDQCSVAGRLVVPTAARQRQRASRRGMKGNGAVQPLLFTMGDLLSEAVEQITTFSLPFLTSPDTVGVFLPRRKSSRYLKLCVGVCIQREKDVLQVSVSPLTPAWSEPTDGAAF